MKLANMDRKQLHARLTRAFTMYIKLRDTDEDGNGKCFTCGKDVRLGSRNCSAGHAMPKNKYKNYIFAEELVRLQCGYCNKWVQGDWPAFFAGLRDIYGLDKVLSFIDGALEDEPYWGENRYIFEIGYFEQRCKELEREKQEARDGN